MKNVMSYKRSSLILVLGLFVAVNTIITSFIVNPPHKADAAPAAAGGAGATLPYVEIQAENATYTGTLIDATQNRTYPGLPVEAIGRRAVTLQSGQYVEFTVPSSANSIVVRYSIPDSANGAGQDSTLGLSIGGVTQTALATTSRYGWIYGGYPFNNNPSDVRPHHFYDEVHRLVSQMSAGTKVRVTGTGVATTVDLIDFEQVAAPLTQPAGSISLTSYAGVDPSGAGDSTTATQQAINDASAQAKVLWVPQGTYKINTQLHVNNVTIKGAGMWYSTFNFITQIGNNEGFYGNYAPTPRTNVHLSDFAIWGNVVTRNDNDQINGVGGSLTNSTIQRLWIEHTKCGLWLDGPFNNLQVSQMRIRNQNADGVNFHKGVTNSSFTQSHFRNTGDDAMAMWSDSNGTSIANQNNSFTFNTIEMPVLANGIAIYGGTDITVTDNYVADQQAEGGGIHVGNRFSPVTAVAGVFNIKRNTVVRAGSQDYYNGWNFGTGAIWFFALDQAMTATINVDDNLILDSNYEAIHFIGNSISNITFRNNQIVGAGTYAVENRANGGGVTFINTTATGLGRGGYYTCASGFTITDGGGNTGWSMTPVCVNPYPTPIYGPVATVTPQATSTPVATNTPCGGPCPTNTPTNTAVPPTNTPTNTSVPTPVPGSNMALGKPISDSGHTQNFVATNANDGNLTTYWEGLGYPNLLTVDMLAAWNVSSVKVKLNPDAIWGPRTQTLSVLGSTDGTNFTTLKASAAYGFDPATGNQVTISFTTASARYVRLSYTANTGAPNGQAAEFEIYGPGGGPTNTPIPPTNTPTRTNTPVVPTNTPTNTSVGPTNTPTNTPISPTNTPTRTNTPTGATATPAAGNIFAQTVGTAPTIDGALNEAAWSVANTVANKATIGTPNNTVTFGALWNSSNLYVGMKVLDSNLFNDSANIWEDDSVEIYIDANHNHGTVYDSFDRQFTKGYNDGALGGIGSQTGVVHAWAAVTGGYSIELAIPWSNLGVTPTLNLTIGFDVGNNDDDNGGTRETQLVWWGTINNYNNTSAFGHLVLK